MELAREIGSGVIDVLLALVISGLCGSLVAVIVFRNLI